FFLFAVHPPPRSPLFPYPALFRSPLRRVLEPPDLPGLSLRERLQRVRPGLSRPAAGRPELPRLADRRRAALCPESARTERTRPRSEEHTSELQSRVNHVYRLMLAN